MSGEEIMQAAETALVRHKGKWLSADPGTYRNAVTIGLLQKHPDKMVSIEAIAEVQYGAKLGTDRDLVIHCRGRAWKAVNLLLGAGIPAYPCYDPAGHHRVLGIVLVKHYTEEHVAALEEYLEGAEARCEIFCDKVDLLKAVIKHYRKTKHRTNGE